MSPEMDAGHRPSALGSVWHGAVAPENWRAQNKSGLRLESFVINYAEGPDSEISVVSLGPEAGSLLENVNRWRGQLGLDEIDASRLPDLIQMVGKGPQQIFVVTLNGKGEGGAPTGILAAARMSESRSLFFKMTGRPDRIESEKAAFLTYALESHFE